jgi:hypothetical protein
MDGLKIVVLVHNRIISSPRRMKFCYLQQHGYTWRSLLSEINRHNKTNATCSHLHVDSKKVDPIEVENRMMVTRG